RPSLLHLVSAHKDHEANDIFLVVGLIGAQGDRNRSRGIAQNDVTWIGAVSSLRPSRSETGFHLTHNSAFRHRGLVLALHLRSLPGMGGSAVNRAGFPIG